ncbi:phage tail assembly chaperone [Aurantimonas sp. MSK8Z-1]|nr:phage tail assembly chaperone [Aurantimonas sp. MSK8Z-1]MCW4113866.1 phage tail assembly chaperone [Aurantimonas sp. MSK8Z-1]
MALGFGLLGHTTASFWQLTPRELASAASAFTPPVAGPPERSALDALMRHFPDHPVT